MGSVIAADVARRSKNLTGTGAVRINGRIKFYARRMVFNKSFL